MKNKIKNTNLVTRQPGRYPRVSLAVRPLLRHPLVRILYGFEAETVADVDPLLVQYIVRVFSAFTAPACFPRKSNGFFRTDEKTAECPSDTPRRVRFTKTHRRQCNAFDGKKLVPINDQNIMLAAAR